MTEKTKGLLRLEAVVVPCCGSLAWVSYLAGAKMPWPIISWLVGPAVCAVLYLWARRP